MSNSEKYMRRAIDLSRTHMEKSEGGPFGALIVRKNKIIAEGWNEVLWKKDPTAHAEIMAIRKASQKLQQFHLSDCEIYTSCIPCPMCLSAIYWSQIQKVYFAATSIDAQKIGFNDARLHAEIKLPSQKRKIPHEQLLHSEALKVFQIWEKKADKIIY